MGVKAVERMRGRGGGLDYDHHRHPNEPDTHRHVPMNSINAKDTIITGGATSDDDAARRAVNVDAGCSSMLTPVVVAARHNGKCWMRSTA